MNTALRFLSLFLLCHIGPVIGSEIASSAGLHGIATSLRTTGIAEAAIIRKGNIRRGADGGYVTNFKVSDDPDHEVDSIEVSIAALSDDAPSPNVSTLVLSLKKNNASGNRQFENDELTFTSGDPSRFSYRMTATMLDADGEQIGSLYTTTAFANSDIPTAVDSVQIRPFSYDSFELVVGDEVDDVASLEITIYETENPVETEQPMTVDQFESGTLTRVFSFVDLLFEDPSGAYGLSYDLEISFLDADGASLGSADATVTVDDQ
jgi:hypothetical protein